jgi:acetyl esterase/lipase
LDESNIIAMKSIFRFLIISVLTLFTTSSFTSYSQLPKEQPLWPKGIANNPVIYKEEKLRSETARNSSESQLNRVFSCVSTPTYVIHKPARGKSTGVGIVVCPGGGFRDVWFDREGNDFGIWLAQRGITSLVLKYRTFNTDVAGFKLSRNDYNPAVYADARQAIFTLRSMAKELDIDENKIGIGGFSAGGSLSLMAALGTLEKQLPPYADFGQVNTRPDFVGLFYPGLNPDLLDQAKKADAFPPSFIMNGGEDKTTPASNCIELYKILTAKYFRTEMHIYSKGGHGFDSGIDRGYGLSTWRDSFMAWLKDEAFIKE